MAIPSRFRGYVTAIVFFVTIVSAVQAKYSGGTGEPNDPYQITTAADLIALGETPEDYDKHFILTTDIDLDPNLPGRKVFDKAVIATFWGTFDGNGHTISHLAIIGDSHLGLFGQLGNWEVVASVKDLGVIDINIAGSGDFVGGLIGENMGNVTRCYSTGTVSGRDHIGGLVGMIRTDLSRCYSTCVVSASGWGIGGLVGNNQFGDISHCYSFGAVTGESSTGGLVGWNGGNVTHCYSTGAVTGSNDIGGLIGYNYSTSLVLHSVWNMETSGLSGSAGGVGLSTPEMTDPYVLGLNGFANDPNWILDAERDYPHLSWEEAPGDIIPEPRFDLMEGDGTALAPYRIGTADQLVLLGRATVLCDKHFILTADIDLDPNVRDGMMFEQAVIPAFTGVLDGNGRTVSNLTIRGNCQVGLFGQLSGEVRNLGLVNVNIVASGDYVGGLAGAGCGIIQCYASGCVSGDNFVGGLVGYNKLAGVITNCYSTADVSGNWDVGGLVGESEGDVMHCYTTGMVTGDMIVGGLIGQNRALVRGCYSTGMVSGTSVVGGLLGYNGGNAIDSYSTSAVKGSGSVGGLAASGNQAFRSFWDIESSGQTSSAGGTGKSTAEMQNPNTFMAVGWDFVSGEDGLSDVWAIPEGGGYPILWWQLSPLPELPFSSGKGEPNDPYIVSTPKELNSIGHNPRLMECCFKLMADVDLAGFPSYSYEIGDFWYPFNGVFDGSGRTIRDLTQTLFGYVGGTVKGLSFVNPSCIGSPIGVNHGTIIDCCVQGGGVGDGGLVTSNYGSVTNCYSTAMVSGDSIVGGLVAENWGTVTQSHSTGVVNGTECVGGLLGKNHGNIKCCYSGGSVSGGLDVGGLVGYNEGSVTQCYSTGTVIGRRPVGRLVGMNLGIVTDCYTTGSVLGGWLVGVNGSEGMMSGTRAGSISHCYSSVAGLVEFNDCWLEGDQRSSGWTVCAEVTGCFWDIQASEQFTSAAGLGKTTAEMQTAETFLDAGWDFVDETENGTEDIWWILEGQDYPRLWWETYN